MGRLAQKLTETTLVRKVLYENNAKLHRHLQSNHKYSHTTQTYYLTKL